MARLRMTGANNSDELIYVTGVLVDPSASAWVVVITDTQGNIVFSAKGADATARYFNIKDDWNGSNITTATNITAVYIYT